MVEASCEVKRHDRITIGRNAAVVAGLGGCVHRGFGGEALNASLVPEDGRQLARTHGPANRPEAAFLRSDQKEGPHGPISSLFGALSRPVSADWPVRLSG